LQHTAFFYLTASYLPYTLLPAQLYIENGVARTILLKPILQDFEVAKRKMVSLRCLLCVARTA
jgi:hypothetical protein